MSTLTGEVYTTASIAERLGVDQVTVGRWARDWTGGNGSGNYYSLTLVDLLVARAWHVINGEYPAEGTCQSARLLRELSETAIRDRPKQWLLLAAGFAMTFDTAEAGAAAWLASGWPAATLIDLWSTPGYAA